MSCFDSVIFDFDGTVADTGEGVFQSIRYAIDKEGLQQPTDEHLRSFIGPPLKLSFHATYPEIDDETVDRLLEWYRENYNSDGFRKFSLYEGMYDLLVRLNKAGIKTGIASSKPEFFIIKIIESCGLDKLFDVPVGALSEEINASKTTIVQRAKDRLADLGCVKPVMIGDRKFDIDGAKSVGVPCAAVLFGYGSREEFEEHNADYIAKDCDELWKIIVEG